MSVPETSPTEHCDNLRPALDVLDLAAGPNVQQYAIPPEDEAWVKNLKLPAGYGLIGGAARDLLAAQVTGKNLPVRDIDVAAFTELGPDTSLADGVAARLMPDDRAFGHGVQIRPLAGYFDSRDFTINQVAVVNGRLLATTEAANDMAAGVIRPTQFEHDPEAGVYISDRLAIKAAVLQCVLAKELGGSHIEGFDPRDFAAPDQDNWAPASPFHVALGYQKALEYGTDVAHSFIDKLLKYEIVHPADLNEPRRLADFADRLGEQTNFAFRGRALELLEHESQLSLNEVFSAMDYESLEHAHELSDRFGGRGHQYADERKY